MISWCNLFKNKYMFPSYAKWEGLEAITNPIAMSILSIQISSVQFSHSAVSDSLRPHESQHARPPCPSTSPGVHSNSCPSSRWCHPAISSSIDPFSSCPQSLPASESFPMSQLFTWGGWHILSTCCVPSKAWGALWNTDHDITMTLQEGWEKS